MRTIFYSMQLLVKWIANCSIVIYLWCVWFCHACIKYSAVRYIAVSFSKLLIIDILYLSLKGDIWGNHGRSKFDLVSNFGIAAQFAIYIHGQTWPRYNVGMNNILDSCTKSHVINFKWSHDTIKPHDSRFTNLHSIKHDQWLKAPSIYTVVFTLERKMWGIYCELISGVFDDLTFKWCT